ncbi:apoptosis-resistant E3 ubiquitin ligase 1-like [Paramuricea clavata]|uniref:Apoptosis-resistant E3 ubiquitin ligase 1-like n=1 Tax=Paramuricea clavata TaxID=317549 RepID=A0A6S7G906_PARCT|nr:apoptosis-resistant E3 ubiquitin ligase 1-like [Paramuricea clavata]
MIRRDPNQTTRWPFWAFMVVVVCLIYQDLFGVVKDDNIEDNLHLWLKKNSLSFVVEMLKRDEITSFDKFLQLDATNFVEQNQMSFEQRISFINKLNELRTGSLKLATWLESKGLEKYCLGFYKLGYIDLESIQEKMQRFEIKDVTSNMDGSFADYQLLVQAVEELKDGSNGWMIVSVFYFFFHAFMFLFKWLFRLLLLFLGYASYHVAVSRYNAMRRNRNLTFSQYFIGYYLDPSSCQVEWLQKDKTAVGNTASFLIKLYRKSWFFFYTVTGRENVRVEVRNREGAEAFVKERDGKQRNAYCVTFHPKISGCYTISVLINGKHIHGSPFRRTFVPGPIDMSKVSILNGIDTVVVIQGVYYPLKIETRDKYENLCELEYTEEMFEIIIKQVLKS